MTRYTEHRTLETGPLLVADSSLDGGERKCWVGAGGLEGRWVTHAEFRTIVAALVEFAGALPPSGVGVDAPISKEQVAMLENAVIHGVNTSAHEANVRAALRVLLAAAGVKTCLRCLKPIAGEAAMRNGFGPFHSDCATAAGVDSSRGGEHV